MALNREELIVVGIGASAGGLDPIIKFFSNIPPDTNMAFIVVQHLSPDYRSLMPELLQPKTQLQVKVAEDNSVIEPNTIYLNNFEEDLHIKDNQIFLLERGPKRSLTYPFDIFFHTLGAEFKENSVGIVLSGTGTDGTRGIKTIKQEGGLVFVQDPESAEFDGMPNSVINTNLADGIMTPTALAKHISNYPEASENLQLDTKNADDSITESEIVTILEELNRFFGINFLNYKRGTLRRRLANRMLICGKKNLQEYTALIKKDETELYNLLNDFLINVTDFFRDKEAFDLLQHVVIPRMFQQVEHSNTLRIWIPGCASGEEVYTIAMILQNYIEEHKLGIDYKIFATDIDTEALNKANAGIYSLNISEIVPEHFIASYFTRNIDHYHIISSIRSKIVFSKHNLLQDPPFMRMDLVVCRNLLIYLNIQAQSTALGSIHFALKHLGYLFLGPSESLTKFSKYFTTIDSKWKLFQNTSEVKYSHLQFEYNPYRKKSIETFGASSRSLSNRLLQEKAESKPEHLFHKILAEKFSPDCMLIDRDYNLLYINGTASEKLQFQSGVFDRNLLKMLPEELVGFIKLPVRKLLADNDKVIVKNIQTKEREKNINLNLSFSKYELSEVDEPFIIIEFIDEELDNESIISLNTSDSDTLASEHIKDLELELKETKARLETLVEELETSNEELHSSNEELTTANEELQSTNEELQSVNEELLTVNQEFQFKNRELTELNDDMTNLFEVSDISTLYLDHDLKIRKFTPGLSRLFNLVDTDIGRVITSFNSTFGETQTNKLFEDSKSALDTSSSYEFDIISNTGEVYLCKIMPFETSNNQIEGVILTFVDITGSKNTEDELNEKTSELNRAQTISKIGSWYLDLATNKVSWSEELYRMYEMDSNQPPPDYDVQDKIFTPDSWETLTKSVQHTAETGEPYRLELRMARNGEPIGWVLAIGERVSDNEGNVIGLRGVAQDITEQKELLEKITYEKTFSERVTDSISMGVYIYSLVEGTNVYMNPQYEKILGYSLEEINSMNQDEFIELFHPDDRQKIIDHMDEIITGNYQVPIEYRFKHKNGNWIWCYSVDSPFELDQDGKVTSFIGVFLDITDRKNLESELLIAKQAAESANTQKNSFLSNMSHEIRTPINGIIGFADLLKDDDLSDIDRNEYLQIIENNTEQLLNLIDDILDISKIEANELTVVIANTNLEKLLKSVEKNFKQIVERSGKNRVKLVCKFPEKNRIQEIATDNLRLRQVLSNLLSNAIKFSEKGTISFGYKATKKTIKFFVTDEGIGMNEVKLKEIFTRFKQVYDPKNTAQFGGTGLGLSISKGLVELLGGEITVESTFGEGTTFTFTLPNTVTESDTDKKNGVIDIDAIDISGKRILVADDESHVRKYYETALTKKGVEVLLATNGKEAVQIYQNTENIDLVLMDMRMPIMDGIEAINSILKINYEAKIIAQTAYTMNDEEEKVLQLGCVDYLPKPVQRNILLQRLDFWLNRNHT